MTSTSRTTDGVLPQKELALLDDYWRAANYLSVGQIYLLDNPLLREPLQPEHVKPRLLGHWGTTPGLNFIYVHMNRIIRNWDLDAIHEGGELGYALAHAYGAAFDNPDLLVCCVVGDGEAETGPLAASWHSNKFLNPVTDGAVLPILHLNGYKIANPTILARIPREELEQLFHGYGYRPYFVEGDAPEPMHQLMAATLDEVVAEIQRIQSEARNGGFRERRPRWPL